MSTRLVSISSAPAGSGAAGMPAVQRISRVRREYNQFVADETLEDYSLRFTAKSARKWS